MYFNEVALNSKKENDLNTNFVIPRSNVPKSGVFVLFTHPIRNINGRITQLNQNFHLIRLIVISTIVCINHPIHTL